MWEYLLLEETSEKKLVEELNKLGKENWEAFGYTLITGTFGKGHHFVLLKRQKQLSTRPEVAPPKPLTELKYCTKCGASIPLDATHCTKCGQKQP